MKTDIPWWKAWKIPSFRWQLILTLMMIASFALVFPYFFDFIEERGGPRLNDFMFAILPRADVSWIVFGLEYSAVLLGIYSVSRAPLNLLMAAQTYVMVTLLRMLSITLFPLDPPADYIPMQEPFVGLFTKDNPIISRDLFFSGHVSTICSLLFTATVRWHKYVIAVIVLIVGVLLIVQRNHYTIDIIAAPLFTYICFLMSRKIVLRIKY